MSLRAFSATGVVTERRFALSGLRSRHGARDNPEMGQVRDGRIVFDEPLHVPDGTVARVDFLPPAPTTAAPPEQRRGGQWKGRVVVAPDFDVLPDDLREALGMKDLLHDTRGERHNVQ